MSGLSDAEWNAVCRLSGEHTEDDCDAMKALVEQIIAAPRHCGTERGSQVDRRNRLGLHRRTRQPVHRRHRVSRRRPHRPRRHPHRLRDRRCALALASRTAVTSQGVTATQTKKDPARCGRAGRRQNLYRKASK